MFETFTTTAGIWAGIDAVLPVNGAVRLELARSDAQLGRLIVTGAGPEGAAVVVLGVVVVVVDVDAAAASTKASITGISSHAICKLSFESKSVSSSI